MAGNVIRSSLTLIVLLISVGSVMFLGLCMGCVRVRERLCLRLLIVSRIVCSWLFRLFSVLCVLTSVMILS